MNPHANPRMDVTSSFSEGYVAESATRVIFSYETITIGGKFKPALFMTTRLSNDRNSAPRKRISEEQAAKQFPMEWRYFQEHGESAVEGTPLSQVPGMSQAAISFLATLNIRSVEQALDADVANIPNIHAKNAVSTAQEWHRRKSANLETISFAEEKAKLETQNRYLRSENEALRAELKTANVQVEALKNLAPQAPADNLYIQGTAPVQQADDGGDARTDDGRLAIDDPLYDKGSTGIEATAGDIADSLGGGSAEFDPLAG